MRYKEREKERRKEEEEKEANKTHTVFELLVFEVFVSLWLFSEVTLLLAFFEPL